MPSTSRSPRAARPRRSVHDQRQRAWHQQRAGDPLERHARRSESRRSARPRTAASRSRSRRRRSANTRRRPSRSPSEPPTSSSDASVSRYASTTHCWTARPPWRLERIAGARRSRSCRRGTRSPSRGSRRRARALVARARLELPCSGSARCLRRPRSICAGVEDRVRLLAVHADAAARTAADRGRRRSSDACAAMWARTSGRCCRPRS